MFMLFTRALLLLPLLGAAAFFSGTETALFSLTAPQREALAGQAAGGDTTAARILRLLANPRRLITTLILGNEVVNISISAMMTGLVSSLFTLVRGPDPVPERGPLLHGYIGEEALIAICATVLTVPLLIFFGELMPKTVGIKIAPRWARSVSTLVTILTWVLWVPRVVISAVAGALAFPFTGRGARQAHAHPVLREQEFRALVDMGSAEGEIEGTERRMIHNVFEFGDLTVGKIMTRAEEVFALPVELPLSRIVDAVSRQRYSRVPIYRGRRDNVIGILFAKDLVGHARGDLKGRPLQDLLHPPLFVPRRAKCDRLFREFQRRKTHMALVVDEYGKLSGLITMEDLLQALFGDITEPPTPSRPVQQDTPDLSGPVPLSEG
jgi:CBS domain containing-hemolysin-like protein